jgi:hypothetical protein
MDCVVAASLLLAEVAKFWPRGPNAAYAEDEIVEVLLQAVWRGDLVIDPPTGHVPRDGDYRYSLLRVVAGVRAHPGLLFVRPGDHVGPRIEDQPDGRALYDPRERIAWVADGAEPDETKATAAFAVLAAAGLDAYDPETMVPLLRTLPVERDALQRYCERAQIPLPSFWFPKTTQPSTVSAERQYERWLSELARMGRKPGSKAKMRGGALKRFPGLSAAAFDRAWTEVAPTAWWEPRAPTKPKRRDNG